MFHCAGSARAAAKAAAVLVMLVLAAPGRAQDVDALGMERQNCRELRLSASYQEASDCLVALWTEHRDALSREGRIDVLEQMAELCSISNAPKEAQRYYEAILSLDPHWLPADFDRMRASWRQPILDAYHARGYLTRSPGLHNIAVLDFEIADPFHADDLDLESLATALPTFISSFLQETLDGLKFKDDDRPLKIVSHRDRGLLMHEIALSQGLAADALVNAQSLPSEQIVQAGKLQAVQGFLSGSILRSPDGKVNIALRLTSVETAEILCPQTVQGKSKDLFKLLAKALREWIGCAVEGVELPDDAGIAELGPMAQGVQALEHYHQALELAEAERFGEALDLAMAALELRPESENIARLVQVLETQQTSSDVAAAIEPPRVDLEQEGASQ